MRRQRFDAAARLDVPDPDGLVEGAGDVQVDGRGGFGGSGGKRYAVEGPTTW